MNINIEVGLRIKRLREEKNINQRQLADLCGWSQSRLGNYEQGTRTVGFDDAKVIADALGIHTMQIFYSDDEIESTRNFIGEYKEMNEMRPVISDVEAGNWREIVTATDLGDEPEMVPVPTNTREDAFVLRITGNSMNNPYGLPTLPNGSLVIIYPCEDPDNGKIVVAVMEDNKATVKKLEIDGNDRYLVPLNPKYDQIKMNENCKIIGYAHKIIMTMP